MGMCALLLMMYVFRNLKLATRQAFGVPVGSYVQIHKGSPKKNLGCCCDTAWQINTCVNLKLNLLFCENAVDGLNAIVGTAFAVVYVCRSRNLPTVL